MEETDELLNRIRELESENADLKQWQESVNQLLKQMLDMLTQINDNKINKLELKKELDDLWTYASINRYRINSLPYELQDPDYKSFFFKPRILSKEETIRRIVEEGKSISRFGDGEFAAIVEQKRWNFQRESKELSLKLQEVLKTDDDNLLIGLHPTFYMNLFDYPEDEADGVRAYMQPMVRRLHARLLNPDKIYANALFHNIHSDDDICTLKRIWDKRACVFIEGIHTGMGVGNDLFDNCKSIERILGPAENAIDKYDKIIKTVTGQPQDKLILLALGPTATALSYDLNKLGYQAVDIGHIDLIYEAYLRKLPNLYSVDIPFKYCSRDERVSGRNIPDIDDSVYKSQVIAIIE